MTIETFNPKWFYKGHIEEQEQQQIRDLFSDFLSNDANFHTPDVWDCEMLCSYQHFSNNDGPWNEWIEYLRPCLNDCVQDLRPRVDVQIVPQDAWATRYLPGHYQELQNHSVPNCNLTMIYFHQLDNEGKSFTFYDPEFSSIKGNGLAEAFNIPVNQSLTLNVEQGDVIVFPSNYYYFIKRNTSDKERILLVSNWYAMPDEQPAQDTLQVK